MPRCVQELASSLHVGNQLVRDHRDPSRRFGQPAIVEEPDRDPQRLPENSRGHVRKPPGKEAELDGQRHHEHRRPRLREHAEPGGAGPQLERPHRLRRELVQLRPEVVPHHSHPEPDHGAGRRRLRRNSQEQDQEARPRTVADEEQHREGGQEGVQGSGQNRIALVESQRNKGSRRGDLRLRSKHPRPRFGLQRLRVLRPADVGAPPRGGV